MRVTFYGVRGSTPTPGESTVRYGGNTVSTEVVLSDGSVLILDAGTGIRNLGNALIDRKHAGPLSLLLSHVHWDHILGLPFFAPLWHSGTRLEIYPVSTSEQQGFCRQLAMFDGVHFPIRAADIPARIDLVDARLETWRIGSAEIQRVALNHPGGAQGFRIRDDDGATIAYLTDNELGGAPSPDKLIDDLAKFSDGAEMIIHDAQYLHTDMPAKRGWGHSVVDDVLRLGQRSRVPHLVLFHHDPDRDDRALDAVGEDANHWLGEHAAGTRATVAHEGLSMVVGRAP